ncbi:hypothetical protein D3C78_1244620 [compost metagenome]
MEILRKIATEHGAGQELVEKSADAIMAMLDGLWLDWQRRKSMKAIEHGISSCLDLVVLYMPKPQAQAASR